MTTAAYLDKVVIRTGSIEGFFDRARAAAQRADRNEPFEAGSVTLVFEDPQRMFAVLSDARRRLMGEIVHEARSMTDLATRLHRERSAIARDVAFLERMGLVVAIMETNPGHGVRKLVRSVAPRIDLVASLG